MTLQHHAFGWSMYILLGAAIVLGLLNRAFFALSARYAVGDEAAVESQSAFGKVLTWYRKHVSVPALVGQRHCKPWGWVTLPTRLQGLFVSTSPSCAHLDLRLRRC